MKKERIVLFPGNQTTNISASKENEVFLKDVLPGHSYRIGKPSSINYQYISSSIATDRSKTELPANFKAIQGTVIVVNSIIRMTNGKRIAVLSPIHEILFLERFEKIFAQIDRAIACREIIHHDV